MPLAEPYREALDGDGFIVVPNLLDEGWRARLLRAFEDAPAQSSGTQHVRLSNATPELAAWNAMATHPLVLAAAEHVLRRPFHVRDLHGRNPLPGFGQQGLHVDSVPRAAGDPYSVVTALWMIDAFTAENGATRSFPARTGCCIRRPPPTRSLWPDIPASVSSRAMPATSSSSTATSGTRAAATTPRARAEPLRC